MNEQQIRQIVQQELQRSNNASRFTVNSIPQHTHDGINSPKVNFNSINTNTPILGRIVFSSIGDYTIECNLPQTPSLLTLNGNLFNDIDAPTVRYSVWGQAIFNQAYYLQPKNDRTVIVGGISYPTLTNLNDGSEATIPAQSSTFFGFVNGANAATAGDSQFHIVNVFGSATMRMTVVSFSKTTIVLRVTSLSSGYDLAANILIQ
jgi:hypothetical protein